MESIAISLKISDKNDKFDEISLKFTAEEIFEVINSNEDFENFKISIKNILLEKFKRKIIEDTYDHKIPFKASPSWFKALTFVSIFVESYYLITNIEAILDDERCSIKIDIINYSVLQGEKSFNGPGGFLYDIANFFVRIANFALNFANINDKKTRPYKVLLKLLFMMLILMPATLFLYKKLSDSCRENYLDHYLHFNAILSVVYGFFLVGLCVFTGLILRYFTFKLLGMKILRGKEFEDCINPSVYSVTKREWLIRISFGLIVGSIGSILLPYLKPKILALLNKALGENHWVTKYCDFTLSGLIILLGMHVAALRIIIPAIIKILNNWLLHKDDLKKNQPKISKSAPLVIILYFSAIGLFGFYAAFEKKKYFGDGTIPQILTQHSILFFAICFNILAGIFLFKLMMVCVDGRKLCDRLLSDDLVTVRKGQRTIFINKITSIILLLSSLSLMITMIALFIHGRYKHKVELSKIIENQWVIAIITTIFVILFFTAIAIFSKTVFLEKILKNNISIKKAISDLVDMSEELQAIYAMIKKSQSKKLVTENQEESIYQNIASISNDNPALTSQEDKLNQHQKKFSRSTTIEEKILVEDITVNFSFT